MCSNLFIRETRVRNWGVAGFRGDAAMFGIMKPSWPWDDGLIDDRNARPLTIAFAAIVAIWALAFALTLASWRFGAHEVQPAQSPAAISSLTGN